MAGHQTLDLGMVVRIHRGQFSSLAPRSPTEGGPMDCRVIPTTALLALLTRALEAQTSQTGFLDRRVSVAGQSHHYQVFVPFSYTPSQRWPVILFLHGAGERGDDGLLPTQVGLGAAVRQNAARFPAIIVFPQMPAESAWTGRPAQVAIAALEQVSREFQVDSDRVYLTGLSMGGNGVWYLAYRYPSRFAALVPICGFVTAFFPTARPFTPVVPADSGPPFEALARHLRRVPTWIVHGEIDGPAPHPCPPRPRPAGPPSAPPTAAWSCSRATRSPTPAGTAAWPTRTRPVRSARATRCSPQRPRSRPTPIGACGSTIAASAATRCRTWRRAGRQTRWRSRPTC